jgi:hypothetical protein
VLESYLMAVVVGIAAELAARSGRLWLYRKPVNPVVNVIVVFGLVMGGLSLAVPVLGHMPVFLLAWAIGYGYEQLNFAVLQWWDFPGDRFLIFEGRQACAISVGALWGLTPLIVHQLKAMLP